MHNKLYSLNLFLNICMNNAKNSISKPKPKFDLTNNLYLKQYFHNKVNSALKPNFNYSNILTNINNSSTKKSSYKKENNKYNSSVISILDNKKIFANSIKKISIINRKKKEGYSEQATSDNEDEKSNKSDSDSGSGDHKNKRKKSRSRSKSSSSSSSSKSKSSSSYEGRAKDERM